MDNIFEYIINLIVVTPIVMILIISSIKLSKIGFISTSSNKYTKVLERTNLSKDTDVFVVKIGDEGCVLVSSPSKVENIKDLNKEDIELIEKLKEKKKIDLDNSLNLTDLSLPSINKFRINTKKTSISKLKFGGGKYGRVR